MTHYSVLEKSGFKVMKVNFYQDIASGVELVRSHLALESADYAPTTESNAHPTERHLRNLQTTLPTSSSCDMYVNALIPALVIRAGLARPRLDLTRHLSETVEVRRAGHQVPQPRPRPT